MKKWRQTMTHKWANIESVKPCDETSAFAYNDVTSHCHRETLYWKFSPEKFSNKAVSNTIFLLVRYIKAEILLSSILLFTVTTFQTPFSGFFLSLKRCHVILPYTNNLVKHYGSDNFSFVNFPFFSSGAAITVRKPKKKITSNIGKG